MVRDDPRPGPLPACAIQEPQAVFFGMPPGHFGQIKRQDRGIGGRQNQADEFALLRTDAAKDLCKLAHAIGGHLRRATRGGPAPDGIAQPAKPGLIREPQTQRPLRVPSHHGVPFGLKLF